MVRASELFASDRAVRRTVIALVVSVGVAGGGCSADITRFDAPFYGFGGDEQRTSLRQEAPRPPRGLAANDTPADRIAYAAPSARPIDREPLPDVEPRRGFEAVQPGIARKVTEPAPDFVARNRARAAAQALDRPTSGTVSVQSGDTLYGLARKHGTTVAALSEANGLTGRTLKPGQTLNLPSGAQAVPTSAIPAAETRREQAVAAPANWNSSYTVQAGDNPYTIARSKGISVADLNRYNDIDDPRRLRPGTVLKVPGDMKVASGGPSSRPSVAPSAARPAERPEPVALRSTTDVTAKPVAPAVPSNAGSGPKILNDASDGATRDLVARTAIGTEQAALQAREPASAEPAKLKWPVIGRIISPFGKRKDGSLNDGIDIDVPKGTEVRAAGDGVVAYAGNEVKGFGNLLLVRHENGTVTAYAHNDSLLVQRGDRVRRGQVISRSGASGGVDQPMLHFEVRVGANPVDPLKHLEKL